MRDAAKSFEITLNVASFRGNLVICLYQTQLYLRSCKLFQLPLLLRPVEIYLEALSGHLPHQSLLFCPSCFSDSWINYVMASERDEKVLIKAPRELLHYFVIYLLCCIVLSVGYAWILQPKVIITMHSSTSSCCSAREKFCFLW